MLRLLGPDTVEGGIGYTGPVTAISGTGTVRKATNVSFSGTTIPYVVIDEASASSSAATLGGIVTGTLDGSASLFGSLAFGLPQPPTALPGIAEELWLYPLAFAITGPLGAPLTFPLDVPNDSVLSRRIFGWQVVTSGAAGIVLSNPAWFGVK